MDAKTVVKARLLDLTTCVLELVRDGNRDPEDVCRVFQAVKDNPNFLGQFVALPVQVVDVSNQLESWQTLYQRSFGVRLDLSNIRIPDHQPGFDRLIIVAQGLTPNKVYEVCQKHFKCWRYADDLDAVLDWDKEERNPKDGPYAIWVRDRREADEELERLSTNQIKERGLTTETLTERMLHELMYWSMTKKHLDIQSWTFCAGSRFQVGGVPSVYWSGGEVYVGWFSPGSSSDGLRPRAVVS